MSKKHLLAVMFILVFAAAGAYIISRSFAAIPPGSSTAMSGYGLGFYRGAARPDLISNTENWLGRQVPGAVDFYADGSWSDLKTNQYWQLKPWADSKYQVALSIAMLPKDGTSTLAAGASGQYNQHWQTIAQNLVNAGLESSVLRIGHEFNGNWYPWYAANDPTSWPVYWRQIVNTMRAVPGANFKFDWNVNNGHSAFEADTVYPGDAYVDIIGVDAYNQSWIPNYTDPVARWNDIYNGHHGLAFWASFASAHNKPLSLPEWGTGTRPDGHGGGDDAYFIQQMYNFISSTPMAYHNYWDYCASDVCGGLTSGQFPTSAAKFKELFAPLLPASPAPEISINDSTVGTGLHQFEFSNGWTPEGGYHELYYLGNDHYSNIAGSTYSMRFSGTQVKLYGTKASFGGLAAVSIDGGPEVSVNFYAQARTDQTLVYTSPLLTGGEHRVTLRVTGARGPGATDSVASIDRAVVLTGSPASSTPGELDGVTPVTGHDLSLLLSKFNTTYAPYDIDGAAPITGHDLSLLLANFGR